MNTFIAVFSTPDKDAPAVFWGAFTNYPDAHTAVGEWVESHPYWAFEEFSIQELPFGVLL
jgi:hypothetical protein